MRLTWLLDALRPYQHLDPQGWVQAGRALPVTGAVVLLVLGVLLLALSTERLAAGILAGTAGLLWTAFVANTFGASAHEGEIALVGTGALTALGVVFPPSASFLIWGFPAGLMLGGWVGSLDFPAGFLPGFVVIGLLAALFYRVAQPTAAALVGAGMTLLGVGALLGMLPARGAPLAPLFGLTLALAFTVLFIHAARKLFRLQWRHWREQRLIRRTRAFERRALEARWKKP